MHQVETLTTFKHLLVTDLSGRHLLAASYWLEPARRMTGLKLMAPSSFRFANSAPDRDACIQLASSCTPLSYVQLWLCNCGLPFKSHMSSLNRLGILPHIFEECQREKRLTWTGLLLNSVAVNEPQSGPNGGCG